MREAARYPKRRYYLAALALVSLLLAVFMPGSPVKAAPVVTLVPSSGAVGTTVAISGTVFDSYKGDSIHIFFDTMEIDNSPLVVPADGAFSVDFTIPAGTAAGQHWIEIRSETTSTSMIAKNSFSVDAAALSLDTIEGPIGTAVNISGSGFYIGKPVTLYYSNPAAGKIGTAIASATGRFGQSFIIPPGPGGFHQISASNTEGNSAVVQFRVLPEIKLNVDSAGPGDLLNVRGTGFASLNIVNIFFGSLNVAAAGTDDLGSFEIEFSVPDVKPLSYDVKAQDNVGNSSFARFTVTAGANLSETLGAVGSPLTVSGSGFQAGVTVTIYYDDEPVATATTDNNGDFTITIIVPPGDGGVHVIRISDGTTTRQMPFSVETDAPPLPILLLPVDKTITRAEAYFDWQEVADISVPVVYELQIAADSNFSAIVLHKTGLADSQYTLTLAETLAADFKNALYYWRVKAIDGAGNESEWSDPWTFYVDVPSPPALLLPAEGTVVERPVRFSWQSVASLSPPVVYTLQVSPDLEFDKLVLHETGLAGPDYLATEANKRIFKKDTTYYWRVKAIDNAQNASDWSMAGSFSVAPSGFPGWATYTLMSVGTVIVALLAFRFGRRTAYH